jgi:uncharacterized protein YndB with AHSA1/START domain
MKETLTTVEGRPLLRIKRRLSRPQERVWRAVTEPEQLSRWYPFTVTELDLRLGGRIRFDTGAGAKMEAIVTELDPPGLFAFSENEPVQMSRESDDLVRFELRPRGRKCQLVFTHIFDDRYAAASYASGWRLCLDALEAVVRDRPVQPAWPGAKLHDTYVEKFGLDEGRVTETADGWVVRFERQLTQPAERVWDVLTGGSPAAPAVGGPAPQAFTCEKLTSGPVTSVKAPVLLEYEWEAEGRPAGRVRWELSSGTGHGARLVLNQTGLNDLSAARHTALKSWKSHIGRLARQLRDMPHSRV